MVPRPLTQSPLVHSWPNVFEDRKQTKKNTVDKSNFIIYPFMRWEGISGVFDKFPKLFGPLNTNRVANQFLKLVLMIHSIIFKSTTNYLLASRPDLSSLKHFFGSQTIAKRICNMTLIPEYKVKTIFMRLNKCIF